jgi:hypothetical protein
MQSPRHSWGLGWHTFAIGAPAFVVLGIGFTAWWLVAHSWRGTRKRLDSMAAERLPEPEELAE